ncbi:MAG: hypothetical protein K6T61_13950 [Bryobacteraceae bacterium]|nr:hypothetical protein [Bryobacteraceae bacterium]
MDNQKVCRCRVKIDAGDAESAGRVVRDFRPENPTLIGAQHLGPEQFPPLPQRQQVWVSSTRGVGGEQGQLHQRGFALRGEVGDRRVRQI